VTRAPNVEVHDTEPRAQLTRLTAHRAAALLERPADHALHRGTRRIPRVAQLDVAHALAAALEHLFVPFGATDMIVLRAACSVGRSPAGILRT